MRFVITPIKLFCVELYNTQMKKLSALPNMLQFLGYRKNLLKRPPADMPSADTPPKKAYEIR